MSEAIPGRLNLVILGVTGAVMAAALAVASHASWPLAIVAAVVFSFAGNTAYALMHEAVHRHFHAHAAVNETAGRVIAGLFPTAFALQRAFHLNHHRNNRTERERFDYYAPGEKVWLKRVQWYCILSGLYWAALPLASLAYFFGAEAIRSRLSFAGHEGLAEQTSAAAYHEALSSVPVARARVDVLIALAVQAALVWVSGATVVGWALCYAAFAVNWSSLQYTDHAFSPLDREEGAWNLRVPRPVRAVFLNYHYHLVHHRDPSLPWTQLPSHARPGDPSPSFWSIYRTMWAGPRPLPDGD